MRHPIAPARPSQVRQRRTLYAIALALVLLPLLVMVRERDASALPVHMYQLYVPQIAKDASLPGAASTYTVQKGDTLFSIAKRFDTTVGVLVLANHLPDRNIVRLGQALTIPDVVGRSALGYDISWPQCGGGYPETPFSFAVIGINHHDPFTKNGCLADELNWARQGSIGPMLYMNSGGPPEGYQNAECSSADALCLSYEFGFAAASYSFDYANSLAPEIPEYWLDVEAFNDWPSNTAANARVIQGMIDALQSRGKIVGIYSTNYQFTTIAGSYAPGLPNWIPGVARQPDQGPGACLSAPTFGSGFVAMVQWTLTFDGNYLC
ncbi:MAG: LysM peptidoglycan-binding domain-containing protein [Tepidiformaceae bacterium]